MQSLFNHINPHSITSNAYLMQGRRVVQSLFNHIGVPNHLVTYLMQDGPMIPNGIVHRCYLGIQAETGRKYRQ